MYTVKQMVSKVMANLKDMTYSSWEIIEKINEANREIYRDVAAYKPELLITMVSGTGVGATFLSPPLKIIEIRDGDNQQLREVARSQIADLTTTGTPSFFYQEGFLNVKFYPVGSISYTAVYVPSNTDMTEASTSIWPNEWDDRIVEYVTVRLGIRDGKKAVTTDPFKMIKQQLVPYIQSNVRKHQQARGYW